MEFTEAKPSLLPLSEIGGMEESEEEVYLDSRVVKTVRNLKRLK